MSSPVLPHSSMRAPRNSPGAARLRAGMMMSGGVHVVLVAALIFWSTRPEPVRPPVYRVNLVGAPPGPRQVGVVNQRPPAPAPAQKPAPAGAEQLPAAKTAPTTKVSKSPAPAKATPIPTKSTTAGAKTATPATTKNAAPPQAGSGTQGNKGADVVTVKTEGIAFPDQGYLNNIIRQLSIAWAPRATTGALVTEVKFTIHRNGRVTDIEVFKGSGNRLYDIDAQGAVEAVGNNRGFGPLPAVWKDDVLIVYFTFDYAQLK